MKSINELSGRELTLCFFGLATMVIIVAGLVIASIWNHKIDSEINSQSAIQKTQIEQKAATQRTRERMHWLPWYSDEKNEGDEQIAEK